MKPLPSAWATAAALCAAAALSPLRTAHAQSATTTGDAIAAAPVTATAEPSQQQQQQRAAVGPTVGSASVAVRATGAEELQQLPAPSAAAPVNALPAQRNSQGKPKALMIVGGAAFIAGALIGDTAGTAIMIGGAGVGLYGLYLYLQ